MVAIDSLQVYTLVSEELSDTRLHIYNIYNTYDAIKKTAYIKNYNQS